MKAVEKTQNSDQARREGLRVELQGAARTTPPGSVVRAQVTISADGAAVSAGGIFIDLLGSEEVALKNISADFKKLLTHQAMNETFRIAPPFYLAANEIKIFEGKFQLPINFQPIFAGRSSKHEWQIRARVETSEGDFDSNLQPFIIGARFSVFI